MLGQMQRKFGKFIVTLIFGAIIVVFIFIGDYGPGGGVYSGNSAGEVNGEKISTIEFSRLVNRRLEAYRQFGGGQFAQESFVRESVFRELVNRKLMVQAAEDRGVLPSVRAIRDEIRQVEAFQKDGRFDVLLYEQVLKANNYSPASFERMIRNDLIDRMWRAHFQDRVQVTDSEVENEYILKNDKRTLKYVAIPFEVGKKRIKISDQEVQEYLKDPKKKKVAETRFEVESKTKYKGKKFHQVQSQIVRDILAGQKAGEIKKLNESLAREVAEVLTGSKSSVNRANAILKKHGLKLQTSEPLTRDKTYIRGMGEVKDIVRDAFAKVSPIDPAQNGKAKAYSVGTTQVVAIIEKVEKPVLSELDGKARRRLMSEIWNQKQRTLYGAWMRGLNEAAQIKRNEDVIKGS